MQPTTSAQALQGLQQFQSQMQSPQSILTGAEQSSGATQAQQQVQGLQGAIQNTTNLLNQVAPSVMGRTQNSLVTQAQVTPMISNEQAPIQSQLTQQTGAEQTEAQQLAADQTNAQSLADAEITGQQNQLSNLQSIYQDLVAQEAAAQQQQNFEQQLKASEAAAGSGGITVNGSQATPATASSGAANAVKSMMSNPNPYSWYNFLEDANKTYFGGKASYGQLANWVQSTAGGVTIKNGSAADLALRNIFLGTALDPSRTASSDQQTSLSPNALQNLLLGQKVAL